MIKFVERCASVENGHFMYHGGWKQIYSSMNDNVRMVCSWE